MSKPVLQIIITSTRPGRVGEPVGRWFADVARQHGAFEVEVADLAEINLPFMDEPQHPMMQNYTHQHTLDWAARIGRSDAIVFVTPEYNFSFNAQAKNAIDFLFHEWANKPVGFVAYGGMSGGTRAVQALKEVVTTVGMWPAQGTVALPMVFGAVADGVFTPVDEVTQAATGLLDELAAKAPVLKQLRG